VSEPSSPAAFRHTVHPTVVEMHNLIEGVRDNGVRHGGLPAPVSKAMAELADESQWVTPQWDRPVSDTHDIGNIMLSAACDHALSFVDLLELARTPVYSHLVVARATFEAAVVAGWLNQPNVSVEQRVKRGLAEQLYNQFEVKRLGITSDVQLRVDKWKMVARRHGWKTERGRDGKAVVDGERRLQVDQGLTELLRGDIPAARLGHTQWCYLSAVGHATLYGLFESVQPPSGPDVIGRSFAPVVTKATTALTQAFCLLAAVRCSAQRRFDLFGWNDSAWHDQYQATLQHETTLVSTVLPQLFERGNVPGVP
jgi:hypothetical protein